MTSRADRKLIQELLATPYPKKKLRPMTQRARRIILKMFYLKHLKPGRIVREFYNEYTSDQIQQIIDEKWEKLLDPKYCLKKEARKDSVIINLKNKLERIKKNYARPA